MSSLADDERNVFFLQSGSSWELANDNLWINDNKRKKHWQEQKALRHVEHQISPLHFWMCRALSCPWETSRLSFSLI